MAPTSKQPKRTKTLDCVYNLQQWNVEHQPTHSEITILNKVSGGWEVIADLKGSNRKEFAEYIVSKIKAHDRSSDQLEEAINALKLCLESDDLSWEAEQASEVVVKKMEKNVG